LFQVNHLRVHALNLDEFPNFVAGYMLDFLTGSADSRTVVGGVRCGHSVRIVRASGESFSRTDARSMAPGFCLAASVATIPMPWFLPKALARYRAVSASA